MDYNWTLLNHPTAYPVKENGKVVIPANSTGVEIAYGQSSKLMPSRNGKPSTKHQNAYRWHGQIYNA